MRNRMLRSVLAAALSAVVAFGALSGLSGESSDVTADSSWGSAQPASVNDAETPPDSSWG